MVLLVVFNLFIHLFLEDQVMCLTVKGNKKTAKKDITVYKVLRKSYYFIKEVSNKPFTTVINSINVSGRTILEDGSLYFIHKEGRKIGKTPRYAVLHNGEYSWVLDCSVNKDATFIDGKPLEEFEVLYYKTPFRGVKIELGNSYTSDIYVDHDVFRGKVINKGLHSYATKEDALSHFGCQTDCILVKCKIPAGSIYYTGVFEDAKAFASNNIEYSNEVEELI